MRLGLSTLPKELLHIIISLLHASEVECVARTFNKEIYSICVPFLTKRLSAKHHAERMIARFGPKENFEWGPHWRNFDALDLNGDLHWLLPLTEEETQKEKDDMEDEDEDWEDEYGDAFEKFDRDNCPVTTQEDVDDLVATAERLGLALPDEFVRFMRSEELQSRVLCPDYEYFLLGPDGLRKCPASIDGGAGGYIIRFLCLRAGMEEPYYWNLYLDPNPLDGHGHCVLGDEDDANETDHDYWHGYNIYNRMLDAKKYTQAELDDAQGKGVKMATLSVKRKLFATNFEEFLAELYLVSRAGYFLMNRGKLDLPEEVEEYFEESMRRSVEAKRKERERMSKAKKPSKSRRHK